ncbi:MAG: hypothetical protein ABIQ10_07705, partial [Gemmatimonadaceae bacterium]
MARALSRAWKACYDAALTRHAPFAPFVMQLRSASSAILAALLSISALRAQTVTGTVTAPAGAVVGASVRLLELE